MILGPLENDKCQVVWVDFGDKEEVKAGWFNEITREIRKKSIFSLPMKNIWKEYDTCLAKLHQEVSVEGLTRFRFLGIFLELGR